MRWIATLVLLAVLTLALTRFGATQDRVLYVVALAMMIPALLACWHLDSRRLGFPTVLGLAGAGLLLTLHVAMRPTLEARGYLVAALGWMALVSSLWLMAERKHRRFLIGSLLVLGCAEALYGLMQAVGGIDRIFDYERRLGRIATGTLINRNHYAALLNLILPLGLAASFSLVTGSRTGSQGVPKSEEWAKSWLVLLPLTLFGLALLLSRSRGGFLTLLATLSFIGLLLVLRRGRRRHRAPSPALVVIFLVLSLGFGALVGLGGLSERFGNRSDDWRVRIYADTVRVIAENPWSGVGPGMFGWRYPQVQTAETTKRINHAHSDYLEIVAEWGVPLSAVFFAFLFWRLARSVRQTLVIRGREDGLILLGATAAVFGVLLHGLVEFNLHIPAVLMVFFLVLGLAWAAEVGPVSERNSQSVRARWPVMGARVLVTITLALAAWRTAGRLAALDAMAATPDVGNLTEALRRDPANHRIHMALGTLYRDHPAHLNLRTSRFHLEEAIRLNPWSSRAHQELSRILEGLGQHRGAEAELERALQLNPRSPDAHWLLGNLRIRTADVGGGAVAIGRAVALDPSLLRPAAELLVRLPLPIATLDRSWPRGTEQRMVLLKSFSDLWRRGVEPSSVVTALEIWRGVVAGDSPPTLKAGDFFIEALLDLGEERQAKRQWIALTHANGISDPAYDSGQNDLWNGAFDLPLETATLGWNVERRSDANVSLTRAAASEPSAALAIEFSGGSNFDGVVVRQQVVVDAGRHYRLDYEARWRAVTTDQGPFMEVTDRSGRTVLASAPEMLGSAGPERQSVEFQVPGDTAILVVRLRRFASRRIDNRIAGTVWLDGLRLATVTQGQHTDD
ncbi:MAG: O-antigen ligase family protein [Acidobacteriota bacterium]|nr:O-antigen ligase family protein [Acidobacteriota bacterium]